MAKEKISDNNKKIIDNLKLKGKQFEHLSQLLDVSESTTRKASKIGSLLNRIDDLEQEIDNLEQENRSKDVQIAVLKSQKAAKPFMSLNNI